MSMAHRGSEQTSSILDSEEPIGKDTELVLVIPDSIKKQINKRHSCSENDYRYTDTQYTIHRYTIKQFQVKKTSEWVTVLNKCTWA